jgi:serine/threonine protein kinase
MKREDSKELKIAVTELVEDSSSLLPSSYQAYTPELVEANDSPAPLLVDNVEPQLPECALSPEATREQFPNLGERYEVLALVGRGGMGVVYKVRDKAVDKVFAVKVLNHDLVQDKISVKRFEQEAKAASALTHANLAAVYDYGVGVSGCPFLGHGLPGGPDPGAGAGSKRAI